MVGGLLGRRAVEIGGPPVAARGGDGGLPGRREAKTWGPPGQRAVEAGGPPGRRATGTGSSRCGVGLLEGIRVRDGSVVGGDRGTGLCSFFFGSVRYGGLR